MSRSSAVRLVAFALSLTGSLALPARGQATHTMIIVGVGDVETGQFLRGVEVRLKSLPIEATTDSMGQARLYAVRPGSYILEARRSGYQMLSAPILVGRTDSTEMVMLMRVVATQLDPVSVSAPATQRGLAGFDVRRTRGLGQFITQTQLDSAAGASLDAILRTHLRGVSLVGDAGNGVHVASARSSTTGNLNPINGVAGPCFPVVYLDGVQLGQDTKGGADIGLIATATIAGIEYYGPSEVPAEYRSSGSFSPAQASESFNPDLLCRGSGAKGCPETGAVTVTASGEKTTGVTPTMANTNSWSGATLPHTIGGPTDHAVTSPACGVMLIWTRK